MSDARSVALVAALLTAQHASTRAARAMRRFASPEAPQTPTSTSSPSPTSSPPPSSGARATPCAMQNILRNLRLGSVAVTCSVKPLEHINATHENVIANCTIVDRNHPRIPRCVEEEARGSSLVPASPRATAASRRVQGAAHARSASAGDDDSVPLYARRKWKPPVRLDVRSGAALGQIEPADESV